MATLEAEVIRELLEVPDAWDVHVATEVASTNDAVLELPVASAGSVGSVLFAETQSAGRGRRGNPWFSGPPEANLIFSCRVQPSWPTSTWSRLTHLTALAVKRSLEHYPPSRPLVKWPNDVYLGDAKVCGILAETEMRGAHTQAVIGIGINVNLCQDDMPESIRELATSLHEATGLWIDRQTLAARLLDSLAEMLATPLDSFSKRLEELKEAHYLLGKPVRVRLGNTTTEGEAIDLGPEGELILQLQDGTMRSIASADEVRLIR